MVEPDLTAEPKGLNSSQGEPSSALIVIPRDDFVNLLHQQRERIESLAKEDEERFGRLEEQISEAKFGGKTMKNNRIRKWERWFRKLFAAWAYLSK